MGRNSHACWPDLASRILDGFILSGPFSQEFYAEVFDDSTYLRMFLGLEKAFVVGGKDSMECN